MDEKLKRLRGMAARPVLRRIQEDRESSLPRLRKPLAVVEADLFAGDLNASSLWRKSGVRDHNCSTWFHDLDPSTPAAYIAARRLDVAAEMLLLDQDQRILDVAMAVSYPVSTFNRAFGTQFGQSPSGYRKTRGLPKALRKADTAFACGNPWAALDHLKSLDETKPEVAGRLGLAWHGRAADEMLDSNIDAAYEHLAVARRHYSTAGELPRRLTRHRVLNAVSFHTDDVFLEALCNPCRKLIFSDRGVSLDLHLRDALRLVPTDLEWFQACCDDCYRVIWKALLLARYGFLPDARQAWWLYRHAEPDDLTAPPSVGRFIALQYQIEGNLHFQNQNDRYAAVERSLSEAERLRDSLLESEAHLWRANLLRALADYPEARNVLKTTSGGNLESPWLLALHHRFSGLVEQFTNNRSEALAHLGTAAELYKNLDKHAAGKLIFQMGTVLREMKRYEKAIDSYSSALGYFDSRRDPLPAHGPVPISLAVARALLGDTRRAREEISRCCFDRGHYRALAASETFTRGCIAQKDHRPEEALGFFIEAQNLFEQLDQQRDAALAASESVEAYYALGQSDQAMTCCEAAARFFETAGCPHDTLEAVQRLKALLRDDADGTAVATLVRRLAQQHGGWLPEPERGLAC